MQLQFFFFITYPKYVSIAAALAAEEANNKNGDKNEDSEEKPCLNWVLDNKFKKEQIRLKIPEDPNEWTTVQVKHWFQWAVRQFELVSGKNEILE